MKRKITSFQKFRLLLWKNFVLQWNEKFALLLEIMLPVSIGIYIVIIRSGIRPFMEKELRYPPVQINNLETLWKWAEDIPHTLAYSPKNSYLEKIVEAATTSLGFETFIGVKSSNDIEGLTKVQNFTAVIEFHDSYSRLKKYPEKMEYKIRLPSLLRTSPGWVEKHPIDSIWPTEYVRAVNPNLMPLNPTDADGGVPPGYLSEGFIQIQHAVAMAYIQLISGESELPTIVMRRTPYPQYSNDVFLEKIADVIPFWMTLAFMASTIFIAKHIAREKELQLKEIIKIMGVANWIHWLAWFVRCFLVLGLVSILIVIILKLPLAQNVAVFEHSDWTVLLIYFLVFNVAVICYSFMMAIFFDLAATAASVTGLVFFLILMPIFAVFSIYDDLHLLLKLGVCLNLNFAQPIAMKHICYREGTGEGAQWSNFFTDLNEDDNLSLGLISLMMLIASFLFMIVCLYCEKVFPGDVGIPRKWYFPFKRSFWCGTKKQEPNSMRGKSVAFNRNRTSAFENDPENANLVVEVKNLGKRFGKKWAVKNLSLNMFQDEITVLLGHNGAGKTATILMLAGMISPTMGTAVIEGCDLRTDSDCARASMGICLQRNVLFDQMSIANHLTFYSKLKGLRGRAVHIEVDRYLKILQLKQQANDLASKLSGGVKRKLALCCALCGNSKVVLCDEPSTGLDPAERRQLWDLLQAEKTGRTVLLTTHYMDDADVLGDRIAIMRNGELKCHGTSFFLKRRFGTGYRLICVKTLNSNVPGLTNVLQKYIYDIEPESEVGSELTYILPSQYAHVFGKMLEDMEAHMTALGFSEFGIGITSLEEVFLKVGAEIPKASTTRSVQLAEISSKSFVNQENPDHENAISSKNVRHKNNDDHETLDGRSYVTKTTESTPYLKGAKPLLDERDNLGAKKNKFENRKKILKKKRPPTDLEISSSNEDVATPKRQKGGIDLVENQRFSAAESDNEVVNESSKNKKKLKFYKPKPKQTNNKLKSNCNGRLSSGKETKANSQSGRSMDKSRRTYSSSTYKEGSTSFDDDAESDSSIFNIESLQSKWTHKQLLRRKKHHAEGINSSTSLVR